MSPNESFVGHDALAESSWVCDFCRREKVSVRVLYAPLQLSRVFGINRIRKKSELSTRSIHEFVSSDKSFLFCHVGMNIFNREKA